MPSTGLMTFDLRGMEFRSGQWSSSRDVRLVAPSVETSVPLEEAVLAMVSLTPILATKGAEAVRGRIVMAEA